MSDIVTRIDPRLAVWADHAEELCPDGSIERVLRHLPGRRLTALVATPTGPATLKIFANPRARGNARRLQAFAATPAASAVPSLYATHPAGHVNVLEFVPGRDLTEVHLDNLATAAQAAGGRLRDLHQSGAILDRVWTIDHELHQLRRTCGPRTAATVERLIATPRPLDERLVPAHRDCHPAQVIIGTDGQARWIDLDDAAMAPPSLDVGNFLAHITRQQVLGRWATSTATTVRAAFIDGYGQPPPAVSAWERLALARLIALAETRHNCSKEVSDLSSLALAPEHDSGIEL